MLRNCKRVLWLVAWLVVASAVWALHVEITYEFNVRRGIPTDFQPRHQHTVYNWRA